LEDLPTGQKPAPLPDLPTGGIPGKNLNGAHEYIHDPAHPGMAQSELLALEAEYTAETKLKPDMTRNRPENDLANAGFDPEPGQIFVYDDVSPAFRDGFLAEELHHYRQVRDAGHLYKTMEQIEKESPGFRKAMEKDVIDRVEGSGFKRYNRFEYEPYTDVPRPKGVHGS
jgi:hypothetical protein